MKLHVHSILIFLIVIILFPTVWVVMTSLRRDEAAFSTDLFSSRITFQNYIDLLFPEQNIPILIKELQNLIARVKPYDRMNLEQSQRKATELLKRLRRYIGESNRRNELVKVSYDQIVKITGEKSDFIRESTLGDLRQIAENVEKTLGELRLNQDDLAFVLYETLSKERFNSDLERSLRPVVERMLNFDVGNEVSYTLALEQLKSIYEKLGGPLMEELRSVSSQASSLNREIEDITKILQPLERTIIEAQLLLKKDMLSELHSISDAVLALVKMKDSLAQTSMVSVFPVDDTVFLQSTEALSFKLRDIAGSIENFGDLSDLYNAVVDLSEKLARLTQVDKRYRTLKAYGDMVRTYSEIKPRIERVCDDLQSTLERYLDGVSKLTDLNRSLTEKKDQLKRLSQRLDELQQKRTSLEEKLKEERTWLQLYLFQNELETRISSVETIKSLSRTDLLRYSAVLTWLRNFANSYEPADRVKENVRKAINNLRWIEEYRTFTTRFENYSKNYDQTMKEFDQTLSDFEKIHDKLLVLSHSGTFVTSEHLTKLLDLVKLDFVNKVRADLSVVSRRAGTLMKISPFREAEKFYREIDKHLFRIDQIWKEKMKHYFGRWVLNSIVVSTLVALITTFVCATAAYPFSRMRFVGRRYGILSFLLIQMFPGVIFMIAIYNLLNFLGKYVPLLGLDTIGGLALAYLTNIAYNVYLIKGFYDLIPASLEEAAIVDGATKFQSFYMIVLPLARPILVVVFLLVFIGTFNEYVVARIVLQNVRNYTYALGLQSFAVGPYETEWGLFTAAALLGMLPMVILFLSMQRYLVSGLTRGAVKE